MITKKTVLILGAGASVPYGYPSGYQLYEAIYNNLLNSSNLKYGILRDLNFNENDIIKFRTDLHYSSKGSVDAFLEWRPEYIEIGKAAIAIELIGYENTEKLFDDKNTQHWYRYLYNKLNASFDEFDKNKISFITFNYDRSLEHYLFTALRHSYGKPLDECSAKIKNIPIIHVHGILGYLPWQGNPSRGYHYGMGELDKIKESYSFIKIIHENIDNDPEFSQAHKLIEDAEIICFLGFGYNRTNIKRLYFRRALNNIKRISGTTYGLTEQECADIKHNFTTLLLDQKHSDILTYLRNNPIL
jgi:hypothetical protein